MPSSMPTTYTTGNSSPLAEWMVIMVTQSSPFSMLSRSVYRAISFRKPERVASSGCCSRKPRMLDFSSCTFSMRPRLSMSFFSSRART